jgi:hypothetical protein|tara:strand:+ start:334 stop:1155 length:822 start_codon:yes stop_codon:yes gene_type:complete
MSTKKKNTQISKAKQRGASLLRQLMGAAVGGSLALGIYYAYEYGAPTVTAWLTLPQTQSSIEGGVAAQKSLTEAEERRISQRARHLVDTFGQENEPLPPKKDVPDNWDLDAIENLEQAADEGWGGWSNDWPETPAAPQEDDEDADNWDAVWDDTWDDDFEALEKLSYNDDGTTGGSWDDTWDNSYWEEEEAPPQVSNEVAVVQSITEPPPPPPAPTPTPPSQVRSEVVTQVNDAPALPSSGIELWIATILTLCGTVALQRRRIIGFMQGKGVC